MLHNTLAKAKILFNKKLEMYRLVCAFNVTETNKKGELKFPVQAKCNYVSGDFELTDLGRVLDTAKQHLRTNNIQIVE
jgi:hypothetical protein